MPTKFLKKKEIKWKNIWKFDEISTLKNPSIFFYLVFLGRKIFKSPLILNSSCFWIFDVLEGCFLVNLNMQSTKIPQLRWKDDAKPHKFLFTEIHRWLKRRQWLRSIAYYQDFFFFSILPPNVSPYYLLWSSATNDS